MKKIYLSVIFALFNIFNICTCYGQILLNAGYYDTSGYFNVSHRVIELDSYASFYDELAFFQDKNGYWGFMNRNGEIIIPAKFQNVRSFCKGMAAVKENGKWGYINVLGEWVFKPQFYWVSSDFSEGLAWVAISSDCRFVIDKNGHTISDSLYGDYGVSPFKSGLSYICEGHATRGKFVNRYGKEIINGYEYYSSTDNGLIFAWGYNSYLYLINDEGCKLDSISKGSVMMPSGSSYHRQPVPVYLNEGKGFIYKGFIYAENNKIKMLKNRYKDIDVRGFYEGLCWVKENELWGVIDTKGNYVISPRFDAKSCAPFCNGISCIIQKDQWGYVDKAGNWIWLNKGPLERGVVNSNISIQWTDLKAYNKDSAFMVVATSDNQLKKSKVIVNGKLFREFELDKNKWIYVETELKQGENEIQIIVEDAYGINSMKKTRACKSRCQIEWLSLKNVYESKNCSLEIGVKSENKITAVNVYVNGSVIKDRATIVPADDYDFRKKYNVTLQEGRNTIKVEVANSDGTTVSEKEVICKSPQKQLNNKRLALIMGNANYSGGNKLENPINDVRAIAAKLDSLGFTVIAVEDQTKQQMEKTIGDFGEQAKNYDATLFYYAGHGKAISGVNYMVPVGDNSPNEESMKYNCVPVDYVMDVMESSGCKMNVIVLDACRDNVFPRSKRTTTNDGFAQSEPPEGIYIDYSTKYKETASDGLNGGNHSPYALAFLEMLEVPNLEISVFFDRVRAKVYEITNRQQRPTCGGNNVVGTFVFNSK